ncbi:helix-turn-helix transcriptional regulator [Nocardia testacea]|uniref:helix-turn-helix transcriptional regulator n=1 Tax=Nocardia testacea TaxID=248551 RepID=UPI003A8B7A1F
MQSLAFDSEDLGATEAFLNDAYTRMQIGNDSPRGVRTRIRRDILGPVSLDRLDLGFDMAYDADPLQKVCLVTVHTGTVEEDYHGLGRDTFTPGDSGLLTPHDLPYTGVIRSARYDITMFEPELLDRLATTADPAEPVRLSGHRPVSQAANRQLTAVITHLQRVAADPVTADSTLLAATGADYLAATVLATMPTTAVTDVDAADRRDAHPETVRRAVAYLESHLHEDVTVTEVAAAAFVTPRALQLAFRRHLGTTPLRYLRRLRLAGAHDDLQAAVAGDGRTVATIAYRWGFAHPGRFAIDYRRHYGRSPSEVLHA